MTRRKCYEMLLTMEAVQANPDIVDVLNKEIVALDKRSEREKKARDAKNPDGDTLKEAVLAAVPSNWATIDDILANVNDDSATRQKVVNRISKLVKEGSVQKQTDKTEDKTVTLYCLA